MSASPAGAFDVVAEFQLRLVGSGELFTGSLAPSKNNARSIPQAAASRPRWGGIATLQLALDFTGSVRNRPLEAIKGGSSIAEREVCCPSSISRKFSIALVMFSLNFPPA